MTNLRNAMMAVDEAELKERAQEVSRYPTHRAELHLATFERQLQQAMAERVTMEANHGLTIDGIRFRVAETKGQLDRRASELEKQLEDIRSRIVQATVLEEREVAAQEQHFKEQINAQDRIIRSYRALIQELRD